MKIERAKLLLAPIYILILSLVTLMYCFLFLLFGQIVFEIDGAREFSRSTESTILIYVFSSFVFSVLIGIKQSLSVLFFLISRMSIFNNHKFEILLGKEIYRIYKENE